MYSSPSVVLECVRKSILMMVFSVTLCVLGAVVSGAESFTIQLDTVVEHDDGKFLWFHPRTASVPGAGDDGAPLVVMTLQKHLQVSDFYSGMYVMYTDDMGATWTAPEEIPELAWRDGPDDTILAVCDVTPGYHPPTGKVLAIGAQLYYRPDGQLLKGIERSDQTAYSIFDPQTKSWTGWNVLEMPEEPKFNFARNACSQWLLTPDDSLLLPVYFGRNAKEGFSVTVARCSFDGETLRYVEHGNEMTVSGGRGLYEPSLVRYYNRYYLTLRNDARGYVAVSDDGLHFEPIRPWQFDDGKELGSYNTQQHWLVHTDGLYLVYTRRGYNNDHVIRNRAPLFIAEVNPETLQVIRATEQVLIPERGATLGNFGATAITQGESWVTVGEGIWNDAMRTQGATGALYAARVKWTSPNGTALHPAPTQQPRMKTVDLNIDEAAQLTLADGTLVDIKVNTLTEQRDPIREVVRRAEVSLEVNDTSVTLVSGLYNLPQSVGGVLVDCPVTQGYNKNSTENRWSLEKDVRLRLWPGDSPIMEPDAFVYPARQRWFASQSWFDNEPVDGGSKVSKTIYYHSGVDLGGVEGRTEVVSAVDALVVSAREKTLPGFLTDTPVKPRYDVVYLYDARGWFYRYSHMAKIDDAIQPGVRITKGTRIGWVGKEGASGGWTHIHFEIKCRQPGGGWGTFAAYALLREAYERQYQPDILAFARNRYLIMAGDTITLDGSKSWSRDPITSYDWQFTNGETAAGVQVNHTYTQPGDFSEVLKITDAAGRVDYDFALVQVLDPETPDKYVPGIHIAYEPSLDIKSGQPITFTVRAFGFDGGEEVWYFGDGSPEVRTQSGKNSDPHAPDGYTFIEHAYAKPGHYLVHVYRENTNGKQGHAHLHVIVGE